MNRTRPRLLAATVLVLLLGAAAPPALAATLYVANNGLDSPSCGPPTDPCRSISRALENAPVLFPRDRRVPRIIVGPGRYGDLDGDGVLDKPGEETSGVGTSCECMIRLRSPVEIESSHGAPATVVVGLDFVRHVRIQSSDVTWGKPMRGFTMAAGNRDSHGIDTLEGLANVTIQGNLMAYPRGTGVALDGTGHRIAGNVVATAYGYSTRIRGANGQVRDNVLIGSGLWVHGKNHVAEGNVVSAGGSLVDVNGPNLLAGNHVVSQFGGFDLFTEQDPITLESNAVLGNTTCGIKVIKGSGPVLVARSNIFGNGALGASNCGLESNTAPVVAAINFWGSAGGPGADPADEVLGAGVLTAPIALTPFAIPALNLW